MTVPIAKSASASRSAFESPVNTALKLTHPTPQNIMGFMANHLISAKPLIPAASENMAARQQLMQAGARDRIDADIPVPEPLIVPLSIRELDVLQLMAMGDSNTEIARKLVITLNTTKKHVNHIFGKLSVTDRSKAVRRARELRLVV